MEQPTFRRVKLHSGARKGVTMDVISSWAGLRDDTEVQYISSEFNIFVFINYSLVVPVFYYIGFFPLIIIQYMIFFLL